MSTHIGARRCFLCGMSVVRGPRRRSRQPRQSYLLTEDFIAGHSYLINYAHQQFGNQLMTAEDRICRPCLQRADRFMVKQRSAQVEQHCTLASQGTVILDVEFEPSVSPTSDMESDPLSENFQDVPDTTDLRTASKVEACRICFATDCKLYPISMYNNLDQAYETLTGLSMRNEDDLFPPFLCAVCAQRLLNCIHFRTKSLRAHLVMTDIVKNHNKITLESLKTVSGNHSLLGPKLTITHNSLNYYNLTFQELPNTIGSSAHILNNIKLENADKPNQDINGEDISNDLVYSPRLDMVIEYVKTDSNDNCNETQTNHSSEIEVQKHKQSDAFVDLDNSKENPHLDDPKKTSENTTTEVQKITKATKRKSETDNSDTNKLSCDTKNESKWHCHLKLHSKPKSLSCYLCSYVAEIRKDLRYHIKTHNDDGMYPCKICNSIYRVKGNLKRHLREHSGEKPFSCGVCKRKFKQQDHYKLHLKVHSGEKPHTCYICKKSFTR